MIEQSTMPGMALYPTGAQALQLLVQLTVIIIAARISAAAAAALRQSPAVGEICAGLCLGPSVLGALVPDTFAALFPADGRDVLTLLSQFGLLLLMFQIGTEFDFALLRQKALRRSVGGIAAASLSLPFVAGVAFGYFSQPVLGPEVGRTGFSLLLGIAFAITALPILGRILMELGLERSRIGVVGITTAAVNDLVGWIAILCFGVIGKAASVLGIFGGLLLGICVQPAQRFVAWWRSRIAGIVNVLFLPVFFTYTGLRIQLGLLEARTIGWCLALIALALVTKLVAGYWSARRLGFTRPEASALGVMMNTRGLMELVVANVGLDLGLFPQSVFAMLVLLALISTAITTPALKSLMPKLRLAAE